jgi:diaminopimelate epimerase
VRIAKAHGLGNDFLLVPRAELAAEPAAATRRLCDRHRGVGADGVIFYEVDGGRASMRLYNADGGEAEISGNGLRCLSGYLFSTGAIPAEHVVATQAGDKAVAVAAAGPSRFRVVTDLGAPILASDRIPIAVDPPRSPVVGYELAVGGRALTLTSTSMGNPHCALFFEEPASDEDVRTIGAALERHALFPRRTNVEFITVLSRREIRVRFWERGVGYTSASGTGAASAAVASILNGRTERTVRVACDGGVLEVEWPEGGGVRQTGEVEVLFTGEWLAGGLAP